MKIPNWILNVAVEIEGRESRAKILKRGFVKFDGEMAKNSIGKSNCQRISK